MLIYQHVPRVLLGAFVCDGGRPIYAGHIVVANWDDDGDVRHVHVLGVIAHVKEFLDTLICG